MKLLYDPYDLPHAKKLRDERFRWLIEMGAVELSRTSLDEHGFLFAYQHGDDRYRRLVDDRPRVLDRPEQRHELLCLDEVLQRLDDSAVDVPRPKTWVIGVDDALPNDLE